MNMRSDTLTAGFVQRCLHAKLQRGWPSPYIYEQRGCLTVLNTPAEGGITPCE